MLVTRENLSEVIEKLSVPGQRGLDTETTGLSEDDSLFSLIIAEDGHEYYFNFNNNCPSESARLDKSEVFAKLRPIFYDEKNTWFIQNAPFDMRMLSKEGCDLRGRVHCTYAIERVIKNNYFGESAYRLAGIAARRGWAKDSAVEEYLSKNRLYTKKQIPGKKKIIQQPHFDKVPFEIMLKYGENDAKLHRDIGLSQITELASLNGDSNLPSIIPVAANELRLTKTLYRMGREGIRIDRPRTAKALEYEMDRINQLQRKFKETTGVDYIDSSKVFKDVFDKLGETYPRTEKGNPSFAADALEAMQSPVAGIINQIRYHEKRAGTYYSSFIHLADKNDKIHPDARQAGTETGRMSYRDPNLQNVSKEDDEADQALPYHVRECFIPEEGGFFYSVDYKQMEYRMMMDYAGETKVIQKIMDGVDFHDAIAQQCGITRKQAKTLNFALSYGAGTEKIAKMLGISQKEAYELKCTYFGNLPKLQAFFSDVRKKGEARGFIFNWFGRRCHIANRDWAYVLPNHLIQGGCADVVKIAMNRIDDLLLDRKSPSKLKLQVHDELLIWTPYGDEKIIEPIVEIMESVYKGTNGIKLQTSIEHSIKSWGYRDKIKGKPYESAKACAG